MLGVWVLIRLWKQHSVQARTYTCGESAPGIEFRVDWNDFGFVCVGLICSEPTSRLQTYCHLSTNGKKMSVSWQFFKTYGVISYGSGWRKDAVNQCLEFGWPMCRRWTGVARCAWKSVNGRNRGAFSSRFVIVPFFTPVPAVISRLGRGELLGHHHTQLLVHTITTYTSHRPHDHHTHLIVHTIIIHISSCTRSPYTASSSYTRSPYTSHRAHDHHTQLLVHTRRIELNVSWH